MPRALPPPVERLYAAIAELEPSQAEARSLIQITAPRRRRLRPAALAIAGALILAAGAVAATGKLGTVPGFGGAGTRHDHAPGQGFVFETPLYAVADARVPHFGDVRLTYRRSSIGDCHGILFDEPDSPGTILSRPAHGEGCGDSSTFTVGTLGDRAWLLIHGRAPAETERVLLRVPGRAPRAATLVRDAGRVPYVAFLLAVPRHGLCDARVSAVGTGLVDVGGLDVGGTPSCTAKSATPTAERKWSRPR